MAETKAEKLRRIPAGTAAQNPLPTVPKLAPILSKRHPELKAEYEAYDLAWETFFKQAESRAS